jgi:drug/metabolite transporter (DMT)-like permease
MAGQDNASWRDSEEGPRMNLKSEFYVILSSLIFSTMGLMTRELNKELGVITQVSFRLSMACIIFFLVFRSKGTKFLNVEKKDLIKLFVAGFFGYGVMVIFIALSFINTSYANASTFLQITPFFVLILSWLFLREKITVNVVISTVLALLGALIIFKPDLSMLDLGMAFALISAILNSIYVILIRYLRNIDIKSRLFYFSFFGGVFFLPVAFFYEKISFFSMKMWIILFIMAIGNVIAYYLLNLGAKTLEASAIGILGVSQAVFGIIISYLIGEKFPGLGLLGAVLILLSIVAINVKKVKFNVWNSRN